MNKDMISYTVKINNVPMKEIHVVRVHSINEEMEKCGYEYRVIVYDYQNETSRKVRVIHKRQENEGVLLKKILDAYSNV